MAGVVIGEAQGHPAFRVKYKGVFDYNKLTTFMLKWLQDRRFEINEKKHKHKYSCPHGFEIDREIHAWRKIDDYYRYDVQINWLLWDAFEVDAVKDGKNVKLWNARMEVQIHFDVVYDYQGKFEKNPWLEKLRDKVLTQYIIKKEIIVMNADPLYYKLLELHKKVKEFLEMETATSFG